MWYIYIYVLWFKYIYIDSLYHWIEDGYGIQINPRGTRRVLSHVSHLSESDVIDLWPLAAISVGSTNHPAQPKQSKHQEVRWLGVGCKNAQKCYSMTEPVDITSKNSVLNVLMPGLYFSSRIVMIVQVGCIGALHGTCQLQRWTPWKSKNILLVVLSLLKCSSPSGVVQMKLVDKNPGWVDVIISPLLVKSDKWKETTCFNHPITVRRRTWNND